MQQLAINNRAVMPRRSVRRVALRALETELHERTRAAAVRDLFDDQDSDLDAQGEACIIEYQRVASSRYVARPLIYRRREDRWLWLLYESECVNDTEFLQHFCLQRGAFFRLVKLLKSNSVFRSNGTRPCRGDVRLHLLIMLKFLGACGNANTRPAIALFLGTGSGTVESYMKRPVAAMMKLESSVITWPDEHERKVISSRIKSKYGFVNCVGIIDGTLLPLAFKP